MLVVCAVQANGLEAGLAEHGHGAAFGIVKLEVGGEGVRCPFAHDGAGQHGSACFGIDLNTAYAHGHEGELRGKLGLACQQRNEQLESAIENAGMHVQRVELGGDGFREVNLANDAVALDPATGNGLEGGAVVQADALGHGQVLLQGVVGSAAGQCRGLAIEQEATAFTHAASHGVELPFDAGGGLPGANFQATVIGVQCQAHGAPIGAVQQQRGANFQLLDIENRRLFLL